MDTDMDTNIEQYEFGDEERKILRVMGEIVVLELKRTVLEMTLERHVADYNRKLALLAAIRHLAETKLASVHGKRGPIKSEGGEDHVS